MLSFYSISHFIKDITFLCVHARGKTRQWKAALRPAEFCLGEHSETEEAWIWQFRLCASDETR